MGYVVFVLILLCIVALLLILAKSEGSKKQRIIVALSVLVILALIGVYNILQESQSERLVSLKSAFLQKQDITCTYQKREIVVNSKDFSLSNGTMSFQGKSDEFKGIIIPLQDCALDSSQEVESSIDSTHN